MSRNTSNVMTTWRTVSSCLGRNELPLAMLENWHQMPYVEQAKAVAESWVMAEFPSQIMDVEVWLTILDRVIEDCGVFITDDGVLVGRETLPENLTLWRGAFDEFSQGMSWTSDRDRAIWFAHRLEHGDLVGRLYEITIPRSMVFARFDRRGENEFVVDINQLNDGDVKEVSE